ncbi:MAG TPA: efflux RND transporter permease subunit [Sphingobium sp.]|uniref:efflux RND transporter permease subunit n=1 Tax=Sphingobium sp. TaxID=1912891 RepID=UPI002ED37DB9
MSVRVSAWSVRNPIPVAVLFIALTIAGLVAYAGLPVKRFPNVALPMVSVAVSQSGAAPSEMESQVTRPVEDALAGIAGVKHVTSTTLTGSTRITVEFELGSDLQKATDDVRTAVERTRVQLPAGIDPPVVQRVDLDNAPIMTYAVAAPGMTAAELSWFVDDTVTRTLQARSGVAQVNRVGGVDREINILLDPERMAARGVTPPQVNAALAQFSTDDPGGRAGVGALEQTIRVIGSAADVAALRALTIPVAGGALRLSDIAEIGDGSAEIRSFATLDGQPVIGFQVSKTAASSDVSTEDNVRRAIEALRARHPSVRFDLIVSTVDETRASFSSTKHVLVEGMVLAALVVFLFLRDWRATAIAALAMPLSLIPTFAAMTALGFSLNNISLLALTLVIGILVDDAIVEIENIQKRIEAGLSPYRASIIGADAIGLAVVATTMTIVAVFVPVSMMGGTVGQFFREFGLTVSAAVVFSLVVARLVTPLLCAYFLNPHVHAEPVRPFTGRYYRLLEWALNHRLIASVIGATAFVAALAIAATLPTGFQPVANSDLLYIKVQGPPDASHAQMTRAIDQATTRLRHDDEVTHVFASIGSGGAGGLGASSGASAREGTLTVLLKADRTLSTDEFRVRARRMLRDVPDVRFYNQGDFGTAPVEIVLLGADAALLERTQMRLLEQMQGLPQLADPRAVPAPPSPELIVTPRSDQSARLNVDSRMLAQVLRIATIGDIDANVAKLSDGTRRVPIRVRLAERHRSDLATLGQLRVPTRDGRTTALETVADLSFRAGPGEIVHYDRERRVSVEADLSPGRTIGDALAAVHALPAMRDLPDGISEAQTGDVEAMSDLFGGFIIAMLAGIGLMYGVLVLLFHGFFKPFVILSALPLSLLGAFALLKLFGMALDLPSMIGLLMLLGLCAKNSILLTEFALEDERAGQTLREALRNACHERTRPIVMTTVAMAAGMLPTALGFGEGSEFRQPMALAVIGGLVTSTGLSLLLVPVVYSLIDSFERRVSPRLAKLATPRQPGDDLPIDPAEETNVTANASLTAQ